MAQKITEALGSAKRTQPGRIKATLITPGQGSSGTYTAELLQQAANDKIFGRGTQMHINHNTATEDMERPEGDLRNLAGVLLEDAYWDGSGLVAEARISSAWSDFVDEFHEFIGISISAQAEVTESGEIARFLPYPFTRADFVTVAGRGGEVAEVIEAARLIESRSIVATETTDHDIEMWLDSALRDRLSDDDGYGWYGSIDHNSEYVYYRYDGKYYRLPYEITGSQVVFTGDPVEVHRRTEYDPINVSQDSQPAPAGVPQVNQDQEVAAMATIEDSALAELQEKARRADELAAENQELREARDQQALEARQSQARSAVREAFGEDAPALYVTAAESAAASEDYDHAAFTAMVNEAAGHQAQEAGTPNLGGGTATVTESKTITDEDIVKELEGRA